VLSSVLCNDDGSFYQPPMAIAEHESTSPSEKGSATLSFTFVTPDKPGEYRLFTVFRLPVVGNLGNTLPAVFRIQ